MHIGLNLTILPESAVQSSKLSLPCPSDLSYQQPSPQRQSHQCHFLWNINIPLHHSLCSVIGKKTQIIKIKLSNITFQVLFRVQMKLIRVSTICFIWPALEVCPCPECAPLQLREEEEICVDCRLPTAGQTLTHFAAIWSFIDCHSSVCLLTASVLAHITYSWIAAILHFMFSGCSTCPGKSTKCVCRKTRFMPWTLMITRSSTRTRKRLRGWPPPSWRLWRCHHRYHDQADPQAPWT